VTVDPSIEPPAAGPIRVLIVDDHPLVRGGLVSLLDGVDDIDVVAAVETGEDAVTVGQQAQPDVVLMDIQLPGIDGIEATRRLLSGGASMAVVVLTSFSDTERILSSFEAGAVGYLLKDATPDEVLSGVRSAANGDSPIAPRAARALVTSTWRGNEEGSSSGSAGHGSGAAQAGQPRLTDRELDVLRLVRHGHANKQIARRLAISEATVKAHLTSIFQRIGVRDRTQAALWAHERGL
jgi:DNA-binding NarL/FixJ family response regulator